VRNSAGCRGESQRPGLVAPWEGGREDGGLDGLEAAGSCGTVAPWAGLDFCKKPVFRKLFSPKKMQLGHEEQDQLMLVCRCGCMSRGSGCGVHVHKAWQLLCL